MGKHKRRKREEALEERLRELESRLNEWSRHDLTDDYSSRPSQARSSQARSSQTRSSRTRSRSRSPLEQQYHARSSRRRTSRPRHRSPQNRVSPITSECNITAIDPSGAGVEVIPIPTDIPVTKEIPTHIEDLLGHEGTPLTSNSIELHESLATRWTAILCNGLETDTRTQLVKKHDPPKNLIYLTPPILNEEVAAAMNENNIKRDKRIAQSQTVLAASITTVGKVLNNMIATQGDEAHIQTLSDAARLLCDLYHDNSITRRSLILPGLNKDMKELMEQTPISGYLFGDKLQEKVNTIKAVKKSGQELKNTPQTKVSTKPKPLNYRRPQRPVPRPSGQKPKLRQATQATKTSIRSRQSPQRQHHPRRRVHR